MGHALEPLICPSTIPQQGAVFEEPLWQEAGPRRWCLRRHRPVKQATTTTTTTTTGTGQSGLSGEARQCARCHVCVQLSCSSVCPIHPVKSRCISLPPHSHIMQCHVSLLHFTDHTLLPQTPPTLQPHQQPTLPSHPHFHHTHRQLSKQAPHTHTHGQPKPIHCVEARASGMKWTDVGSRCGLNCLHTL